MDEVRERERERIIKVMGDSQEVHVVPEVLVFLEHRLVPGGK